MRAEGDAMVGERRILVGQLTSRGQIERALSCHYQDFITVTGSWSALCVPTPSSPTRSRFACPSSDLPRLSPWPNTISMCLAFKTPHLAAALPSNNRGLKSISTPPPSPLPPRPLDRSLIPQQNSASATISAPTSFSGSTVVVAC